MIWTVFFICALLCLLIAAAAAFIQSKIKNKKSRLLEPSRTMLAGIVLCALLLFFPIYYSNFKSYGCGLFETLIITIYSTIKLFLVDGDFDFIVENVENLPSWLSRGYYLLSSFLLIFAPIMTFGVILSFFKNISAYKRYISAFKKDVYIFSDLNERSLTLAESLYRNDRKSRAFVFTNVHDREDDEDIALADRAKEIGAMLFRGCITTVDFRIHSSNAYLNYFAIGNDDSENVSRALKIIECSKYRDKTNLYVFSTNTESEMILTNAVISDENASEIKIKVRRVNEVRSFIMRTLYENGYENIFRSAEEDEDGTRKISALIVGFGNHGREMTKALSWLCQMDGYDLHINAFELDPLAEDKFVADCPELMSPDYNGNSQAS